MPSIVSLHVGRPRRLGTDGATDPDNQPWETGSYKDPVEGPLWLGRTNLIGDGQADLVNHGGLDKAVCVYPAAHYPDWREELKRPDFTYGAFGENISLGELTERQVCLGDTFAIGEANVQVSQPRQPCWKLSRRWRIANLATRVQSSGRTGWYFRVLDEGEIELHQSVQLLDRPCPEWPVIRVHAVIYDRHDREGAVALAACPHLSTRLREMLAGRTACAT